MRISLAGIIAVAFLALEIVGMALMAGEIGGLRTFLWLVVDVFLGVWLIRSSGAGFMPELMHATASGQDPISAMWRTGRRFLAGLFLVFPGFITDAIALVLLLTAGLPQAPAGTTRPHSRNGRGAPGPGRRGDDDVIEGEFRRED